MTVLPPPPCADTVAASGGALDDIMQQLIQEPVPEGGEFQPEAHLLGWQAHAEGDIELLTETLASQFPNEGALEQRQAAAVKLMQLMEEAASRLGAQGAVNPQTAGELLRPSTVPLNP